MIWTTLDGRKIPTKDMTHQHRVNSINKIIRDKKLYTQHIKPEMYNTTEGSLYILDSWLEIVQEHNARNARVRIQREDLDYLLNIDWRY